MAIESYVKFVRGTPTAYENAKKQGNLFDDTLYFIHDADAAEGSLYLGSKLIAGSGANVLGELNDVYIDSNATIEVNSLLSYDGEKWVVSDLDTLLSNVSALKEIQIFETTIDKGADHASAITLVLAGTECKNGDIVVITEKLTDTTNTITSYIYRDSHWVALNNNNNTENVYLSFERTGAFPLDKTALFSSYDEAAEYAAGEGDLGDTSYIGQIVSVYDSTTGVVSGYIISADRTLEPLGTVVTGDEKTIESEDNVFSLKDYGKRYYAYVPAEVDTETGATIQEAHYELREVSTTYPWKAGLEPRVVSEDNELVLGWFEPNPTTIEGVNNQVGALQTSLSDLEKVVEDLSAEVGDPAAEGVAATGLYAEIASINDELADKADASNVYTKDETLLQIDAKIAAVDHLKRKIVDDLDAAAEFIAANPTTADQYIYMVPATGSDVGTNDSYDEYMVVNGVLEKVGSWETDLSGYVKSEDLTTTLADYAKTSDLDNYTPLNDFTALSTTVTGLSDKLNNLEGDLSDLEVRVKANEDAIKDLQTSTEELTQTVESHTTQIETNKTDIANALNQISTLDTKVDNVQTNLVAQLENYVLKTTYNADMAIVMDAITWHNLNDDGTEV